MVKGDAKKNELKGHIIEPGKIFQKDISAKPRLTLRERDEDFFHKYVQEMDFKGLLELDDKQLDESQRNIQSNSKYLLEALQEKFDDNHENLAEFTTFLIERCFLVAVSTCDEDSAFRIFSVMNSRGLDLQSTDIIKANIIGKINKEAQENYTERWEDMETELGRQGFNDLFGFVRMIYAKEKAQKTTVEEFRQHVLSKNPDPEKLIEDILEPFAESLSIIRKTDNIRKTDKKNLFYWLNQINNSDWIPIAILFLSKKKNNLEPKYVSLFFKKLERLASYLHICAKNINQRIVRYKDVLIALESNNHNLDTLPEAIELSNQEKAEMKGVLANDIFGLIAVRRNFIILRLDSFISSDEASYIHSKLTIEHVLPQTVNEDSEWYKTWPDIDKRQEWVHKIANLLPLNKSKNSKAQNFDFDKKKNIYYKGNSTPYHLTSKVLLVPHWTEEYLIERQKELLKVFEDNWELQETN